MQCLWFIRVFFSQNLKVLKDRRKAHILFTLKKEYKVNSVFPLKELLVSTLLGNVSVSTFPLYYYLTRKHVWAWNILKSLRRHKSSLHWNCLSCEKISSIFLHSFFLHSILCFIFTNKTSRSHFTKKVWVVLKHSEHFPYFLFFTKWNQVAVPSVKSYIDIRFYMHDLLWNYEFTVN